MAEKLSELAKRLEPFLTKTAQNAARVMISTGEGPGIDVVNGVVGLGGDSVLLYHSNGSPVSEFAATTNGLVAALDASVSGDIVLLPAKTIASPASANYIPGDEISSGNFTVKSGTPITVSGLTIGELYAIEGYNGPWRYGNGAWFYGFGASIDGSSYTEFGLHSSSGEILNLPAWGLSVVIVDDGHHGRLFFEASTTSILLKIVDSVYSDNSGSLSWRLQTASETNVLVIPSGVELVGMGKNSIIDGDVENNGIITNLKATGTITGSGIVRLVGNPIAETFSRQIKSLLATGTSPFDITSTTLNTNLNSDLLDGKHASELANASHSHAAADITDFGTEVVELIVVEIAKISLEELENVIEACEAVGDILQIDDYMEIPGGAEALYDSALLTLSGTGNEANAFNENFTDEWVSPTPAPHYVDVTFDRKRFVSKIVVTANSGDWMWADHPTGCTVYGSHTGAFGGEETSIIAVSGWGVGVQTITISGVRVAYKYYRLIFTRGDANMRINEIEIYTAPDEFKWVNRTPAAAGLSEVGHTHTESEITDLDHDAVKIQGKAVSATAPGDGETLIFNSGTNTYEPGALTSSLIIEEVDTTPSILNVAKIIVPNGSLIDNEDGSVTLDFGSAATDGSAIHDNVASEISAITEKTSIAADDMFIIEDSAAGNAKKMLKASRLVSGGFYGDVLLRTVVAAGGQANFDINSIPSGYDVIKIFIQGKSERTDTFIETINVAFNNDTTATNYYREAIYGLDATATVTEAEDRFFGWLGSNLDAQNIGQIEGTLIHPSSPFHKTIISRTTLRRAAAQQYVLNSSITWENTAAITRITLTPAGAYDFAEGTLCLIVGYKNH